jgi:hypothetical protein
MPRNPCDNSRLHLTCPLVPDGQVRFWVKRRACLRVTITNGGYVAVPVTENR